MSYSYPSRPFRTFRQTVTGYARLLQAYPIHPEIGK